MKKALRVVGATVGILVLAVAALLSHFAILGGDSDRAHATRLEQLRAAEVTSTPSGDTREFDDVSYDHLQVVATHNSYALRPTWLQTEVIRIVEPAEAPALQYDHASLTDQLDAGIRSFELDVRWDGTRFTMVHVPLVANRATAIDFGLALEEIAIWSDRHTDHLPISIMVEVKEDYMFLDPTLLRFEEDALLTLDTLIAETLEHRLFTPAELDGGPWPTVGELRERVLLYFGDNESVRERYVAAGASAAAAAAQQSIFTSSKTGAPDARFAIVDDPRDPLVASLLADGVIVRTRADANLLTDPATRDAAFASGAQIVSTDFPPSEPQTATGYMAGFAGGALVRVAP